MRDNLSQRVGEFCDAGGLEEYREEVELIFAKIYEKECRISSQVYDTQCKHEFFPDGCLIRISFKKPFDKVEEMIWTILHEFGHHLSGRIPMCDQEDKSKIVAREKEAWRLARLEVLRYPRLAAQMADFDRYAAELIAGYVRVLGE